MRQREVAPFWGVIFLSVRGAKIVGAITIGNNVTIGANAFVNKSIQDDVVVGGIPTKILRHKLTGEKVVG